MIILGLLLLVVSGAVVVNAGVVNRGPTHGAGDFTVFGLVLEGATGTIFLYGAVAGAAAIASIYLTVVGTWRAVGHRITTHRELRRMRRETETLAQQRDELADQLNAHDRHAAHDRHSVHVRRDAGKPTVRRDGAGIRRMAGAAGR